MKKRKKGNLKFFDPTADRLILQARAGSVVARRRLLQAIADQAVPHGDLPNPIQGLIQTAFSKAAQAVEPADELLKGLGLRTVGRPRVDLTADEEDAIFDLAVDLYGERWRYGRGCRLTKVYSERLKSLAKHIGVTETGLKKILDPWVAGIEEDAEWRRREAD